jgi:dipeptidyl aminopeptidase/acylaminoacyl peptidase
VDLLTAPLAPEPLVHRSSSRVALLHRETVLSRDRLARRWYGLAGFRFDPATGTSGTERRIHRVEVVSALEPGPPIIWEPSGGALLWDVRFSPDGRWLSAVSAKDGPARLAFFDIETQKERILSVPLQAAWGSPCDWVAADALVCRLLMTHERPRPPERIEPDVLEHSGGATPLRTYSNLLDDSFEEDLFEFHFSSEIARVQLDGTVTRIAGTRGLLSRIVPSPDGHFAEVTRIERPYSRLAPARRFPSRVEIWDLENAKRLYASDLKGLGADAQPGANEARRFVWRPGVPTTIGWLEKVEASDSSPAGTRWVALEAPFASAEPREVARSERAIHRFGWSTKGTPVFSTRTDVGVEISVAGPSGPRVIWQGASKDLYDDPGRALRTEGGRGPILEWQGRIFLAGDGLGPKGPRPFLDALQLDTLEVKRLFQSDVGVYETVVAMIDPEAPLFVTSRETESQAPNLFAVGNGARTALRHFPSPYPALDAAERRRLDYERKDGVKLRGTLYLPPDWATRAPLPTLVWIYPREYSDRDYAEQVDVRMYRYHRVRSASPLAAVLAGYAVLVNPTMPIIGEGDALNDEYLEQLVENARAAVEHLVELGVTDPERVAISGHSYGAFSTANLLIHSRLFATGMALSGAYNRTLTPFGFQHEKRSLWKATDFYARVSPFFSVDQLAAPLLLVHGAADANPGTPTLQARRFFHALVGVGGTARYVEMPFEGHHLRARESVLHVSAEMIDWLDRTIGSGAPEPAAP